MDLMDLHDAINLRLALLDLPHEAESDRGHEAVVSPLLARQRELTRRLDERLPRVDERVQLFLDDYLSDVSQEVQLPRTSLVLDQPGLARELSLPADGDYFSSSLVRSYRLLNGVLHNPHNDRRTTAGVFHIADGGLPVSQDKLVVPKGVFAALLDRATRPPQESMVLPYTSQLPEPAACFVSLLLRPLVSPAVPGAEGERRMEIRFMAPGSLVSNLDFVEGIFGNGGDPYLPDNDAAMAPQGWTGHTGYVILAPHLTSVTKKELGLPHHDDATPRQRRDGMCWKSDDELYNNGQAFKACARDERGVIVTVIADNYFGYCKKEVKTQIGYSANLSGQAEEEHAGGALAFPSYDLGQEYTDRFTPPSATVEQVVQRDPEAFELQPEGHAEHVDYPFVVVPAQVTFNMREQNVTWPGDDDTARIPLRADRTYFSPDGYRVRMQQHADDPTQWALVGTAPWVSAFHKPSTVSGGGKSEISKAITDAINYGNAYVADFAKDMATVEEILAKDFGNRFADPQRRGHDARAILGPERSVGSVIKLLTPSELFTDEYNAWLETIPSHVKELIYVIKSAYRPEWGQDWRKHFSVGVINGRPGNALRLDQQRVAVRTLRVGFDEEGAWRVFGLRPDFAPAVKVQTEDDITASIVVPAQASGRPDGLSGKVVENCERLLFQRPDEAIHRGYDKQAELDISAPGTFLSNFEPLDQEDAVEMTHDAVNFSRFTGPVQELIEVAAHEAGEPQDYVDGPAHHNGSHTNGWGAVDGRLASYFVCSAQPRLVDGKPSKNPRYLQVRPDLSHPVATAASLLAMHLHRGLPVDEPLPYVVDVVAAGRRNNPPEEGVPALCAFNPLHYLELPELFMEFISSMTGKSPSTTGAGSEGALTKAPFNAMPTTYDLNAALLSYILTGYDGWISSAGYIGPRVRVDHDISLLVPEVFSRMRPQERAASRLVAEGYLERVTDIEIDGRLVEASRLGYRITKKFASTFFGRIFMHPEAVFTPEMLRPEKQDLGIFVDAVDVMITTHERVAKGYFEDGTADLAIPPLRALLEIMAYGKTSDGHTLSSPEVRELFTRENVLASDWYAARLDARQAEAVRQAERGVATLASFNEGAGNARVVARLGLEGRLADEREYLEQVSSPEYREALVGTIGRQVSYR
ncbi:hypothetical protein BJY21_001042 [Kineosphaera limosa]|nr:hypothetical protein [Kineosphaera limosa]NYD99857.1 hypothetical protein [Kineosphaera limosa]